MTKVALIKSPSTYADWYKQPMLGLTYLAAIAESSGYECKVFDAYFNSWTSQQLVDNVCDYKPDLAGFTAMTHEISRSAAIAEEIKKRLHIPMLVGGCHVSALPEKTLEEFPVFDYGIYGEGEKTIQELLSSLEKGNSGLSLIKGLAFRDSDGRIRLNEPRPLLSTEELNNLPFPALHQYYNEAERPLAKPNANYVIMASRGCPFGCIFCMRVLGDKVRQRSVENVFREMELAREKFGARSFDFLDEIILSRSDFSLRFLQKMIDSGLAQKIKWRGSTRVDLVDPETINLAKRSGCYRLGLGVESGDDAILKSIGKRITVAQIKNAVKIIHDGGIAICAYFILGHPNETQETIRKTVDLAARLNTELIAVGIMVPYPGTKIFEMAQKNEGGYRLLSSDWQEFDKYGGKSLELKALPYEQLVKWQKKAYLYFYIKNYRFWDLLKIFWEKRKAVKFFIFNRRSKKGNYEKL